MVCIQLSKKTEPLLNSKNILIIFFLIFLAELSTYFIPDQFPGLIKVTIIRTIEIITLFSSLYFFNLLNEIFFGNNFTAFKKGVFISAFIGLVFFFLVFLFKLVLNLNILNYFLFNLPGRKETIVLFLTGGIISPLAEELFFRGIIYKKLRQTINPFMAIMFSSIIFASFHLTKTGLPIIQLVGGIIFALSYEYSKNLITPYIIHMTGNIFLFSIPLLYKTELVKSLFFN